MTLAETVRIYGDPYLPDFERRNIVLVPLPYHLVFGTAMTRRVRCHRLAADKFSDVFDEIFDAGLHEEATHYSGIYALRKMRGHPDRISAHAWGLAIDLNAERLPQGSDGDQHPGVTEIFKRHGFAYGGDFQPVRDPMHYSLTGF